MRVFITGASGYVGSAIVEVLVRAGHHVTGLVRSDDGARTVEALRASVVRGDLLDVDDWLDVATASDALIHAALESGPSAAHKDRRALESLLDAARQDARRDQETESAAARVVVYTSGVMVLGHTEGRVADEDYVITHPADAVAWRPEHEQVCLRAATDVVATAVIRPGMVYGGLRGGHLAASFAAGLRGEAPIMIGDGSNRWPFIHRDDLAELYRVIVEKRARGIFHGVDGSAVRVIDIFGAAAHVAGGRLPPLMIPVDGARQNMGPIADALVLDQLVSAPRAHALGWRPRHPPVELNLETAFLEWRKSLNGDAPPLGQERPELR